MQKNIYFVLSILVSLLSFLLYYVFNSLDFFTFGQIFTWLIAYIIVTDNLKKIFSLQSFFLLGYGLFFLGRFLAQIFYTIPDIYCIYFILDYCLSDSQILYLNLILYLNIFIFTLPFLFGGKSKNIIIDTCYSSVNIKFLILFQVLLISYYSYSSYSSVMLSLSSGYMALFSQQAEAYETPVAILVYSLILVIFSMLLNSGSNKHKALINCMFFYFIFIMLLGILTGSRTSFLTALFMLGYYFFKDVRFTIVRTIFITIATFLIIYSINIIAAISGARDFEENKILVQISDTLFGQGVTLMVFDSSMHINNYPFLGFLKTLVPGIQVFYSFFDVNQRYLFDFSSYLVYSNNRLMYLEGFGLGWSVFSDFYVFSFGFIPLYLFFIYIFSYLLRRVQSLQGNWAHGVLFILATQLFTLNRSSISLIILMLILYCVMTIVVGNIFIRKERAI